MAQQHSQQQVVCFNPDCKRNFIVMIPAAEVINSMTISMVFWAHADVQPCPYCGTPYQMKVTKIQGVEVAWGPVKTQQDAGIVVPPPGFRIPDPS